MSTDCRLEMGSAEDGECDSLPEVLLHASKKALLAFPSAAVETCGTAEKSLTTSLSNNRKNEPASVSGTCPLK